MSDQTPGELDELLAKYDRIPPGGSDDPRACAVEEIADALANALRAEQSARQTAEGKTARIIEYVRSALHTVDGSNPANDLYRINAVRAAMRPDSWLLGGTAPTESKEPDHE